MERQKHLRLLIFTAGFLFIFPVLNAQTEKEEGIYEAYISGNMAQWGVEIERFEGQKPETSREMLQRVEILYGYTAWLIAHQKEKEAKTTIQKAEDLLEIMLGRFPEHATAHAVFLGMKSHRSLEKALTLDPENVQGLIEKGNMYHYLPGILGGDKEKAASFYLQAIQNMEDENLTKNNWLYLNQLVVLAQIQNELGKTAEAGDTYRKILKTEPNFLWVKDELYPEFLEQTGGR